MKLESQVCSLDLAKKLRAIGVKQESMHHWKTETEYFCESKKVTPREPWLDTYAPLTWPENGAYAAFTVAELGEMLPEQWNGFDLVIEKPVGVWNISYVERGHEDESRGEQFASRNEANARAKMLIYLIEQGIVKP